MNTNIRAQETGVEAGMNTIIIYTLTVDIKKIVIDLGADFLPDNSSPNVKVNNYMWGYML